MVQVSLRVTGASRGATWTWDQKLIPLVDMGGGNLSGAVQSTPGTFLYAVIVFGSPTDAWTATVADGTTTHNHAGHMSPSGFDTTGDTAFTVQQ